MTRIATIIGTSLRHAENEVAPHVALTRACLHWAIWMPTSSSPAFQERAVGTFSRRTYTPLRSDKGGLLAQTRAGRTGLENRRRRPPRRGQKLADRRKLLSEASSPGLVAAHGKVRLVPPRAIRDAPSVARDAAPLAS